MCHTQSVSGCRGQEQVFGVLVSFGCDSCAYSGRSRTDRAINESCNCKATAVLSQCLSMTRSHSKHCMYGIDPLTGSKGVFSIHWMGDPCAVNEIAELDCYMFCHLPGDVLAAVHHIVPAVYEGQLSAACRLLAGLCNMGHSQSVSIC